MACHSRTFAWSRLFFPFVRPCPDRGRRARDNKHGSLERTHHRQTSPGPRRLALHMRLAGGAKVPRGTDKAAPKCDRMRSRYSYVRSGIARATGAFRGALSCTKVGTLCATTGSHGRERNCRSSSGAIRSGALCYRRLARAHRYCAGRGLSGGRHKAPIKVPEAVGGRYCGERVTRPDVFRTSARRSACNRATARLSKGAFAGTPARPEPATVVFPPGPGAAESSREST